MKKHECFTGWPSLLGVSFITILKFLHSLHPTGSNCFILQSQNVSALQFAVFLTGINRLLVTCNGQSAFPSASLCQGQL